MDQRTVRDLQEEFPGSSWALWSDAFPADGCVEEDPERLTEFIHANTHRLHGRVVFLALNPSAIEPPGYQNFHSPTGKHYDDRLKAFIQDNGLDRLVGGYMTDIVPDEVDPDSSNVTPEATDTDRFLRQLERLGHESYDVICFSGDAFGALRSRFDAEVSSHPENITAFTAATLTFELAVYRVWHYSNWGANADKVPELERQLRYLNAELGAD